MLPSHIEIAHFSWKKTLQKGGVVIDATCGNGHDTLYVCQSLGFNSWVGPLSLLSSRDEQNKVYCFDLQKVAIENTRILLLKNQIDLKNISFINDCHSKLDQYTNLPADLIIYNLGYLPGSCKTITTKEDTTLESLQRALQLIKPGGLISITCYPGHKEGFPEQQQVFSLLQTLPPHQWAITHYNPFSSTAPNLLLVSKRFNPQSR